jgi:hypothetical protein
VAPTKFSKHIKSMHQLTGIIFTNGVVHWEMGAGFGLFIMVGNILDLDFIQAEPGFFVDQG